jgi:hypothetical protein
MRRYRRRWALVLASILFSSANLFAQVSGFVSDPALRPFPKAVVEFIAPGQNPLARRRFEVSDKGTFSIDPGAVHVFSLNFVAAYCASKSVMVYWPKPGPLKLDVRLKPYAWVDDFKDVRVIGDFNGFDGGTAVPLRALSDGTYFADVENRIEGQMGYRLTGLVRDDPVSVPGTHYDELALDDRGEFVSRLNAKPGKVRILFDPTLLPRAFGKAEIIFGHPDSTTARIAAAYERMSRRITGHLLASQAFVAAGHDFKDFHYDWSADVAALKKQIVGEKDEAVRQVLWIALLDVGRMGGQEVDRAVAEKALKEIPAESELWSLAGQDLLFDSIRLAGGLDLHRDYFQRVITRNPSRLVRAFALERAYLVARREKDQARAREYYRLLTEDYGDLLPGRRVKSMPPDIK